MNEHSVVQKSFLADPDFDALLSDKARRLSKRHWTPVAVARRAAELLVGDGNATKVLDIGSGIGKFCLVGALTTRAVFVGVEQRGNFCWEAKRLARTLGAKRAHFRCTNMAVVDWNPFDAVYLYNPFYENIDPDAAMDESAHAGGQLYDRYVWIVEDKLRRARVGTRVATYHGFGGNFPKGYIRDVVEPWYDDFLEVWIKQERTPGTGLSASAVIA